MVADALEIPRRVARWFRDGPAALSTAPVSSQRTVFEIQMPSPEATSGGVDTSMDGGGSSPCPADRLLRRLGQAFTVDPASVIPDPESETFANAPNMVVSRSDIEALASGSLEETITFWRGAGMSSQSSHATSFHNDSAHESPLTVDDGASSPWNLAPHGLGMAAGRYPASTEMGEIILQVTISPTS